MSLMIPLSILSDSRYNLDESFSSLAMNAHNHSTIFKIFKFNVLWGLFEKAILFYFFCSATCVTCLFRIPHWSVSFDNCIFDIQR